MGNTLQLRDSLFTFGRLGPTTCQASRFTLVEIVETIPGAFAATIGEGLAGLFAAIVVVTCLPLCARTRRHGLIANV